MSERLAAFARRVADDPFFLASALRDYAQSEGLDDAGLAARLGCSAETLDRLRLCRRPRPEPAEFRADVDRIAERFGVDPTALAEVVRRADVLAELRHAGAGGAGTLMAARDRPGDDIAEAPSPEGPAGEETP